MKTYFKNVFRLFVQVCHKFDHQQSFDCQVEVTFIKIFKQNISMFVGFGQDVVINLLKKRKIICSLGRDENVSPETSTVDRWPLTFSTGRRRLLTFSTRRRRPLRFSTCPRRPDWRFQLVDVDHTDVFNWSTSTTDIFYWSTSTSTVGVGRRPSTLSTPVFTDVFITPAVYLFQINCGGTIDGRHFVRIRAQIKYLHSGFSQNL